MPLPNRVAVYVLGICALITAVVPVLLDFDWESTAGVIAGIGALAAVVYKWLDGWQKYEARTDDLGAGLDIVDDFDERDAELPPRVEQAAHADIPEEGGTTYGKAPG